MASPVDKLITEAGPITDLIVCKKMLQLSQSAADRGIEFGLSYKTVKNLLKQNKCYYTGRKFDKNGEYVRSIDRVDNSRGYVDGNVVACTAKINMRKNDLSVAEITMFAEKINSFISSTRK